MAVRNAFTVDLEDWYHGLTSTNRRPHVWPELESRVEGSTDLLLEVLAEHDVRATFFVLGTVAEQHRDVVRRVAGAGHEIAVHGYAHVDIRRLTPERFADEIDRALEVLAPLVQEPIIGHRGPYFSIDRHSLWALEVLRERGFRYDSSFFPTRGLLYGYPEAPRWPHRLGDSQGLIELPISTVRFGGFNWPIAGGFYTRALPYSLIRRGIAQLNHQGHPAILYVHPWELDTGQQYGQVTPRERVTHYHGRRGLERKLHRLLADFDFFALSDLLDSIS